MDEQLLINAFMVLWDYYPEPVMLIDKKREIIALNKAGKDAGRFPGMKCSSLLPLANHKGCRANEALKKREYTYRKRMGDFGDVVSFWLPIDGYPDYLVHFSVGATVKYDFNSDSVSLLTGQ